MPTHAVVELRENYFGKLRERKGTLKKQPAIFRTVRPTVQRETFSAVPETTKNFSALVYKAQRRPRRRTSLYEASFPTRFATTAFLRWRNGFKKLLRLLPSTLAVPCEQLADRGP